MSTGPSSTGRSSPSPSNNGREAILAGIRAVAAEHLDWHGELPLDARLVEDLELDSIRLLTLAVEVENHFRVALDADDEAAIATVADLVEAIAARLAERDASSSERDPEDGGPSGGGPSDGGPGGGGEPAGAARR